MPHSILREFLRGPECAMRIVVPVGNCFVPGFVLREFINRELIALFVASHCVEGIQNGAMLVG